MPKEQTGVPARYSGFKNIAARLAITLAAVGLFCVARPDIVGSVAGNATRHWRNPHIIGDYLKNNSVRKLQLGAGEFNLPGWLNTDISPREGQAFLDATQPFPLPDSSFQVVSSEQVVEHLTSQEGLGMMKESFRILVHGGKVRVATPNLLQLMDLLRADKTPEQLAYMKAKIDWHDWPKTPDPANVIVNLEMNEFGHRFVYTPQMLRSTMEAAGFTQIRQYKSGESDDPALKGLEVRSHSTVTDIDRYETMVFEGVRP
jgi:predicted SAM-dependent methyltransferase